MPRITAFRRSLPVVQTVSGPPTSGTYAVRTLAIDQYGVVWVCRAEGTPGAWEPVGAKELARAVKTDNQTITGQSYQDVVGLSIVVVSRGRPYVIEYTVPQVKQQFAAVYNVVGVLADASNNLYGGYANIPLQNVTSAPQSRSSIYGRLFVEDPAGTSKTYKLRMAGSHASTSYEIEAVARPYLTATEV